jgi:four helix bundle protein
MLNLSHKKLIVYTAALELTQEIYQLTNDLPDSERYGLTSQLRHAVVSVCSNLAEGAGRISKTEKKRFFEISRSSLVEIDTQIEMCLRAGYLEGAHLLKLEKLMNSTFAMLSKLISNLS